MGNLTAVRSKIADALRANGYDRADDIAFHLTDCNDDFRALADFIDNPDSLDANALEEFLIRFLVHVPNHLAAASKLMTGEGVSDVFGVGATSDD